MIRYREKPPVIDHTLNELTINHVLLIEVSLLANSSDELFKLKCIRSFRQSGFAINHLDHFVGSQSSFLRRSLVQTKHR